MTEKVSNRKLCQFCLRWFTKRRPWQQCCSRTCGSAQIAHKLGGEPKNWAVFHRARGRSVGRAAA